MSSLLPDLVKIQVLSSGTGPFQLGAAATGFRGIEALVDGGNYSYSIQSGAQFEIGTSIWNATSGLLIRTPLLSSNGNAAVSFSANVEVNFVALGQDISAAGGGTPIIDAEGNSHTAGISQNAATIGLASKLSIGDAPQFFKTTIISEFTVSVEGQTFFAAPDGLTLLFPPLVVVNGSILASADFSWDGTGVTLAIGASISDLVTLIIGIGVDQGTVEVEHVVGLPAYIQGVLGSRSANVLDIAGWDGTGTNDMASGYQTLIDQAATAGVAVYAPAGKALLGSTIILPDGHTFEGVNAGSFLLNTQRASTFLIGHTGRGFTRAGAGGAPITITNQVTVRNQPTPTGAPYTPNDLDFDYYFEDISDLKMRRILTLNATRGIYMNGGRNSILEWGGQCFMTGLQIDWSYDTCDFQSIHLWPYWNQSAEVRAYMQDHLTSFLLKRVDNPFFNKIFSIWHQKAFKIDYFAGDGPNKPAGTVSKLKLSQADLDIGDVAYSVEAAANGHTASFSQVTAQGRDEIIASSLLNIDGPNTRIIGDFKGDNSGGNVIRMSASATGSDVSLQVNADAWNRTSSGFPAVEVAVGGGHVDLLPGSKFTNGSGGAVSSGNVTTWNP